MNKTIQSKITFIILQFILLAILALLFITPTMNRNNLNIESFISDTSKNMTNKLLSIINSEELMVIEKDMLNQTVDNRPGITSLINYFDTNPIIEYKLINARTTSFMSFSGKNGSRTDTLEFSTTNENTFGYLLIVINIQNGIGKYHTIRFDPLSHEIVEYNKFYKDDLGIERILLIILWIIIFIFISFTLTHYFMKSTHPRIIPMLLFMISVAAIQINWNDFSITYQLINISIFPISIYSPGLAGVWTVTYYLPIMAIVYWFGYKKHLFKKDEEILNKKLSKEENVQTKNEELPD